MIKEWDQARLLAVFKLSQMWDFEGVQAILKPKLMAPKQPIEKILLARKCKIKEWYKEGILALARRDKALTICEAEQLGLAFTVKLAKIRESMLSFELKAAHAALATTTFFIGLGAITASAIAVQFKALKCIEEEFGSDISVD